jgi:WD40 repeat protein
VLAIGAQLCDVLSYLHTREPAIIFRDLKPANVMLSVYRQVYLIDFGSARFFKPGRPKDTIAFGSPGYAAPEQYGKAQTTPRSDLYSLGALLHQMLTGLDPAESSFQFKPVRKCIANVPDELDQLIMRMLEPEADKRPDSAAEVKTVLERHTAGSWRRLYEQPGTLSSPIYQPRDSFGQPPPDSWATSKPTLAQVQKQLGIPVTPSLASSTSSGNKISRRAVTGAVVALGIAGSVGLLSFAKFPMGHQHKHDAPSSQRQEIGHTYRVYKGHKGSVSSIVWSYMASGKLLAGIQAGGPYIASASFDHTVQVWDASGHRITKMTVHRAPVRALACSPDGRLMASADERACYVWNPLTGRIYLTHILPAGASPISSLSWSPDGQYLAIAADRVYIYQITLQEVEAKATAQIMNIYQGHKGPVTGILWSAYASDDVVTGGADGSIQIWTSEAGQRKDMNVLAQGRPIQALGHLPFPPTTIIFAYDTKILVWDCLKNTLVSTYTGHADTVTALAASPTSKQIASASLDGTVHVWDSLSGKPLFIYRKHTGPVRTVTWRPNDDTIASGGDDRTVRIWQG